MLRKNFEGLALEGVSFTRFRTCTSAPVALGEALPVFDDEDEAFGVDESGFSGKQGAGVFARATATAKLLELLSHMDVGGARCARAARDIWLASGICDGWLGTGVCGTAGVAH